MPYQKSWRRIGFIVNPDTHLCEVQNVFSELFEDIFNHALFPLALLLFADEWKGRLHWQHGYVVGYASNASEHSTSDGDSEKLATRSALVSHTNDSEVTLNISLG